MGKRSKGVASKRWLRVQCRWRNECYDRVVTSVLCIDRRASCKTQRVSRKNRIRICAGALALISAAAAGHWKHLSGPIEMAMYSALTVGLVLVGFWADRRRPRFLIAVCSVLAAHCALLFAIRGIFPFRTILTVYSLAIIEGTALAVLLLKILEYGSSSDGI
jgi:hypothetical protein